MKLSTLECAEPGCGQELVDVRAMWHVVDAARDLGWEVTEEVTYCPKHTSPESRDSTWVVGCRTCGWEEELNEGDAKAAESDHECDPDTYLDSPEKQAQVEERSRAFHASRAEKRKQEQQAAELAAERLQRLERYANHWLRIRNTVLFWRKESIT